MTIKRNVQLPRSSVKGAKPRADELEFGSLAVNFFAGDEFLSTKNSEQKVVVFPSKNYIEKHPFSSLTIDNLAVNSGASISGNTIIDGGLKVSGDTYLGGRTYLKSGNTLVAIENFITETAQADGNNYVTGGTAENNTITLKRKDLPDTTITDVVTKDKVAEEVMAASNGKFVHTTGDTITGTLNFTSQDATKINFNGSSRIENLIGETSSQSKLNIVAGNEHLYYNGNPIANLADSRWEAGAGNGAVLLKNSSSSAAGEFSVSEGKSTNASGAYSHAEGNGTHANGGYSHAEGSVTNASGVCSHAEGLSTTANGNCSHAEGVGTIAGGHNSHAEGQTTIAGGDNSHAEGNTTTATGDQSHAEGNGTHANGSSSHAEGSVTNASGVCSHAEGYGTHASGACSHAEGNGTIASGSCSHAEGSGTTASGACSHAEGYDTYANGESSHAEGDSTTASGVCSHAEGQNTIASGDYSHAEGYDTYANGESSHAEGDSTTASGVCSHAEGYGTHASGACSHAEGDSTTASGDYSHAEGFSTTANGRYSHAEGNHTIAMNEGEHACGSYNRSASGSGQVFSVGVGTSDDNRVNSFYVKNDGTIGSDLDMSISGNSKITLSTSSDRLIMSADTITTNCTMTTVAYFTTSDERLKTNIVDVTEDEIEKAKKVDLKSFNLKRDGKKHFGVVAQEVETAGLAELVNTDSEGMKSVDYTSLLILKIAELEKEIKDLKNQINNK